MIYHCGFTKFHKINHIRSSHGHSRQLEQKINENICQNSVGYISICAPITVTSFYMFYITSSSPYFLLICLPDQKKWARLTWPNSQNTLFHKQNCLLLYSLQTYWRRDSDFIKLVTQLQSILYSTPVSPHSRIGWTNCTKCFWIVFKMVKKSLWKAYNIETVSCRKVKHTQKIKQWELLHPPERQSIGGIEQKKNSNRFKIIKAAAQYQK